MREVRSDNTATGCPRNLYCLTLSDWNRVDQSRRRLYMISKLDPDIDVYSWT